MSVKNCGKNWHALPIAMNAWAMCAEPGLFIGFELVSDRAAKTPDKALALDVIERLRVERVLT